MASCRVAAVVLRVDGQSAERSAQTQRGQYGPVEPQRLLGLLEVPDCQIPLHLSLIHGVYRQERDPAAYYQGKPAVTHCRVRIETKRNTSNSSLQ